LYAIAMFSDLGEAFVPSHCGTLVLSAIYETSPAFAWVISRLNRTACAFPVYASQSELPRHHATLGSDWWLAFFGQDLDLLSSIDWF
jgi:hypothetical protein